MDDARVPPSDVLAEEAILGSLITYPEAIHDVATFLEAKDFYREINGKVYEVIKKLVDKDKGVDVIIIAHELQKKEYLEDVGGDSYITSLLTGRYNPLMAKEYAQNIKDCSIRREMVLAASAIAKLAYDTENSEEVLDTGEQLIFQIRGDLNKGTSDGLVTDWANQYIEEMEWLMENEGEIGGLPTGFADIDRILGGMQRSDVIVIGARPSMGKTALLMQIAINNIKAGKKVGVISLEMSGMQLINRIVSSETHIDSARLRQADLNADEWKKFYSKIGELSESRLFICDNAMMSSGDIKAQARRWQSRYGLDLLLIDYFQLIKEKKSNSRVEEISIIGKGLKQLARELDIPVVVASQLNRAVEQRGNKRPTLPDLRDSGTIEEDADLVAFIYRDEYYNHETSDKPGIAEINIAKNRNGPVAQVELYWQNEYASFRNLQHKPLNLPSKNGSHKPKEPPREKEKQQEVVDYTFRTYDK
jgi:replicative DNA helicase